MTPAAGGAPAAGVTVAHVAPVVVPVAMPPVRDGAVVVEGERIAAVGPAREVVPRGARVVEWPGALTPGLVNAHAHLEYTAYADLATSGLPFAKWLGQFPRRNPQMTAEQWLASAREGVRQLVETGTTAVADVVTSGPGLQAAAEAGLAGVSYVEVVFADEARWPEKRAWLEAVLASAPGRRTVGLSPHAPYSIATFVAREVAALARARGVRLHPHLAETAGEVEFVQRGDGPFAVFWRRSGLALELLASGGCGASPVGHFDTHALLGPDVHVAHGVHVDARDRAVLRERGVSVALCVRSNEVLGAGEPPVAAYLAEGSPIALGTDSRASSPSLDLWEEAAAARALAVRQGYAGSDLDRRLVVAATAGGAAAMDLSDVGALVPGARADLAAFDVAVRGDPYRSLVASGAGACAGTVVAGRVVHRRAP